jgi:hypothetical protein
VKLLTRRATAATVGPMRLLRGMSAACLQKGERSGKAGLADRLSGALQGRGEMSPLGSPVIWRLSLTHPNKDESTSDFFAWNVFWSYLGWKKFHVRGEQPSPSRRPTVRPKHYENLSSSRPGHGS